MYDATFSFPLENTPMTAIPLGPDSISLPRAMFQGTKEPGYIVSGSEVTPWYWEGMKSIQGMRCIYTSTKGLKPLDMLFDTRLSLSSRIDLFLRVLSCLETARNHLDQPWFAAGFPINSLWIIPGSGILILPKTIADVMMNAVSDSSRELLHTSWLHPKAPAEQRWVHQMVALFYAIAGAAPPFKDPDIREAGYDPVPLWMLIPSVSKEFSRQISSWLSLSEPLPGAGELRAWIQEQKETIISSVPSGRYAEAEQAKLAYLKRVHQKAKKRRFLRKRGLVAAGALLVIIIAAAGVIHYRIEAGKPPPTAGMDPRQTVEYYYQLQDELKLDAFQHVLSRSAKNIREQQMIYLHVANAMRFAYGEGETIPAEQWIADGKPSVSASSIVYGITDLEIEPIDRLSFRAEFTLWIPAALEEDSLDAAEHTKTAGFRYTEHLVLVDKETHYLIDQIEIVTVQQVF